MPMKLIPAMSIKGGHVAIVDGKCYTDLRNDEGLFRNPVNVLKDVPGEEAFILDIDGIEGRMPDLRTVKRIAAHKDVWLDAGARDADSMMDLFVSGAVRVVLGTLSLESLADLQAALDISENIVLSLYYDRGIVSPNPKLNKMSLDGFITELADIRNLNSALLFDVGGLKDCMPPDPSAVEKLTAAFGEVYVSGHIDWEHMKNLEGAGVSGLIVDFRKLGDLDERA